MDEANPQLAVFNPTRIMKDLEKLFVVDAAAGEQSTIVVAHGKAGEKVFERVYACGNN